MEAFKELPKRVIGQLIENVIVVEPGPAYTHQNALRTVFLPMTDFIQSQNLGKVLFSPFNVYLDERNVFQPDILFVAAERLHLVKPDGLHGAPDLVIEALSTSTGKFDLGGKKCVYERSGVKEYWIINPDTSEVQGYQLKKGAFQAYPSAEGLIRSPLLGREFRF